jgi:hypothetical protein
MARGSILQTEAYALGKMLDHSSWQYGHGLPRLVTPSDIDAVFDNKGHVLFMELSSSCREWSQLKTGQRLLYQNMIAGTHHAAALCKHGVSPDQERPINSRHDIGSFQLMLHYRQTGFVVTPFFDQPEAWERFVFAWFGVPGAIRESLIAKYAKAAA